MNWFNDRATVNTCGLHWYEKNDLWITSCSRNGDKTIKHAVWSRTRPHKLIREDPFQNGIALETDPCSSAGSPSVLFNGLMSAIHKTDEEKDQRHILLP